MTTRTQLIQSLHITLKQVHRRYRKIKSEDQKVCSQMSMPERDTLPMNYQQYGCLNKV